MRSMNDSTFDVALGGVIDGVMSDVTDEAMDDVRCFLSTRVACNGSWFHLGGKAQGGSGCEYEYRVWVSSVEYES